MTMGKDLIEAGVDAAKEVAVTSGKVVDLVNKFSSFFDGMLQQYGGIREDNMRMRRWENCLKLFDRAEKHLRSRGLEVSTREIPPKFALPLLNYASLEEEEGLREIWARMMANALDASTQMELRTTYVDILKDLTAFDVKILSMLAQISESNLTQEHVPMIVTWHLPDDAHIQSDVSEPSGHLTEEVSTSLSNLTRAGCIAPSYGWGGMPIFTVVSVIPLGMGLYRACKL